MATPTINTYISDMIAVERHIAAPLETQLGDSDVQNSPVALRVVNAINDGVQGRIEALEARLAELGGHAGSPVKNAVTSLAGTAASAIDKLRKTAASKDLRDDYTALCLASAGYTMLHATALGLNDSITAALSQEHLTEVASHVMITGKALPVIVLTELQELGVPVDVAVTAQAEKDGAAAWHDGGVAAGAR